ncbi:MAG: DNA polymerase III subunit epsilon [Gammaproteobacteria bacterium]|nr:DNA polymerase III subunit epsilon [Gammaproteobacteria bacterium]
MTQRQIVLDTETTGIRVEDGHRIIEIGCVELIDRKLTGNHFHCYLNPQREVEAGAFAVHGISNDFLKDKPLFADTVAKLMDFIVDAELIIHNAPFDLSFLNYELSLARRQWKSINDYCSVIDTLQMARQLHAGQRNNLDALCKRYSVDNSKRDLHGALLDAHLLAHVYLAMTGGQGSFFDTLGDVQHSARKEITAAKNIPVQKYNLTVLKATQAELSDHHRYVELMYKQGKCIWEND